MAAKPRVYTTEEAAEVVRRKPATLRREHSVRGNFKGVVPVKLGGTGGLLWPADRIDALVGGHDEAR